MTALAQGAPPREAGSLSAPPRIGMIGAGQLARMTHQAAIGLGIELRVLGESAADPAAAAGARWHPGSPDRLAVLRDFAQAVDVVTFDHEQVPTEHLSALEADGVRLRPPARAKLFAQDKHVARRELREAGFPVPEFAVATSADDVDRFAERHGWPLIAKTMRGGYDGRGVFEVASRVEATELLNGHAAGFLLEPRLELRRELAVIVARTEEGEAAVYPVVETIQEDGICRELFAPSSLSEGEAESAQRLALDIAGHIGAAGIMALELFDTGDELLVNELALRPHNSGHFTIDACATSQFEQHLRAVCGWPLGDTSLLAPVAAMANVISPDDVTDPAQRTGDALTIPGVHVHLYGKAPRPGRKVGHVTALGSELEDTRERARAAAQILEGAR